MYKAKYVMFDTFSGYVPIIFPPTLSHAELRNKFPNWDVVSAGFVQWEEEGIFAYGDSVSLNKKSRPEDTNYIRRYMGLAPND